MKIKKRTLRIVLVPLALLVMTPLVLLVLWAGGSI